MKLYYFWITRSVRCEWLIRHYKIPCDMIEVNLREDQQLQPDFLKINPYGKVPTLIDDGVTITESFAICNYLADRFPEKNMIAKPGTAERGRHDQWMFFCATELDQPLWQISKHSFVYPEESRLSAAFDLAARDFAPAAKIIDDHLRTHKFMMGDQIQAVDFVMAHTLLWADRFRTTKHLHLTAGFSSIQRYMSSMLDLESAPEALKALKGTP